jgi:hypothetical protein
VAARLAPRPVPSRALEELTMPFVVIGTILVLLKLLEVDPVAGWSWMWLLSPFGVAVVWWVYSRHHRAHAAPRHPPHGRAQGRPP